jgi:hypothetical protein
MSRNFSHPLARSARVWSATMEDGAERRILVIVTTIELDPKHDGHSEKLVRKLARAAAIGFMLVNRPKDWLRG